MQVTSDQDIDITQMALRVNAIWEESSKLAISLQSKNDEFAEIIGKMVAHNAQFELKK